MSDNIVLNVGNFGEQESFNTSTAYLLLENDSCYGKTFRLCLPR